MHPQQQKRHQDDREVTQKHASARAKRKADQVAMQCKEEEAAGLSSLRLRANRTIDLNHLQTLEDLTKRTSSPRVPICDLGFGLEQVPSPRVMRLSIFPSIEEDKEEEQE